MQSPAITSRNRAPPKSLALIPSTTTIDGRTVFGHQSANDCGEML